MELDEIPGRLEHFDVVMLKPGKSQMDCTPADFERLPVEARDPLSAQMSEVIREKAKEGYTVLFAAKPGQLTDPEMHARSRASETVFDRSKY